MTEDTSVTRQQRPAWIWGLLIIGLLLLCCLCCVCCAGLGAAGYLGQGNISSVVGPFALATPTVTPLTEPTPPRLPGPALTVTPPAMPAPPRTPGPIPTAPLPFLQGKTPILRETFDANTRGWRTQAQGPTRIGVENGQLHLTMDAGGQNDIIGCADGCGPYSGSYYYQADLTVKIADDVECYTGLAFGLTGNDYYSFVILQDRYHLAKSAGSEWLSLIDLRTSTAIRQAGVNTLGVYVHAGQIDLYINGILVDTYKDPKPLAPGQIGFVFINKSINKKSEVLMDNVLVYANGSTAVPAEPTPTVTLPFLQGKTPLLRETFDTNTRVWRTQGPTQVRVENGQLRLTMGINDQHDIVWCADGCGPYPGSYYYQADLTLETAGDLPCWHGLVFGLTGNDYYSFQIQRDIYHLAKSVGNEWLNLIDSRTSTAIHQTGVNTLGVYVHAGQIDLYINGIMVDTYSDPKPLAPGQIGFFIKNIGEVLVDNVLVYTDATTSAPAE